MIDRNARFKRTLAGTDIVIDLHAACGFVRTGLLPSVGFKFGRWVDSVLMQKALGEGDRTLPDAAPQRGEEEGSLQ